MRFSLLILAVVVIEVGKSQNVTKIVYSLFIKWYLLLSCHISNENMNFEFFRLFLTFQAVYYNAGIGHVTANCIIMTNIRLAMSSVTAVFSQKFIFGIAISDSENESDFKQTHGSSTILLPILSTKIIYSFSLDYYWQWRIQNF